MKMFPLIKPGASGAFICHRRGPCRNGLAANSLMTMLDHPAESSRVDVLNEDRARSMAPMTFS